jgi:colanic acid/amylovoran biosynthesis glycosyltransferase
MSKLNVCVVLPYNIVYSETFLQAHIDRLSASVRYLQSLPIDIDDLFSSQPGSDSVEEAKRRLRATWHRFLLNPLKKVSLKKFLAANKVNVVLAEYGTTGVEALKSCRDLNMPLVVHFHGFDAYSSEVLDHYATRYKRLFSYARALISVSTHMTGQLIRLGAPREKVFYNPYGVDVSKFRQPSATTAPLQVIATGRFVEKKAPYLTILAFRKVLDRLPEARLTLVGNGALYGVCQQIVKSLHMDYAVDIEGTASHDEVARLMQQSRIFVQHSVVAMSGDSEGTPNAILEAGASGLPVVTTRHGGIADVVIHGRTGFLVEEGDIDTMSEYMYRLLSNPELAAEMGQNARHHVSVNFSLDRSIANLRRIIEEHSS